MIVTGFNYFTLSTLFGGVSTLITGFFVYFKDRKNIVNRTWLLLSISAAIWGIGYFLFPFAPDKETAIFRRWVMDSGAILIPANWLYWVYSLLNVHKERKKEIIISYICSIIILSFNHTRWFAIEMVPKGPFKYYPTGGIFYFLFFIDFFIWAGYGFYRIYNKYLTLTGFKAAQLRFMLIASFFGFMGGGSVFLMTFNIPILPYPVILFSLYPSVTSYAIIRYRLMEIDTVIHRTFLWLLTLLLLILPIGLVVTLSMDWIVSLSRLAKLALTSAVLIFFVWYYSKLKPRVDHFFRRRKYDYYQVLGEIGQKIGSELDINNVVNRLFKELKEVIYIRNGIVLVQQPGQLDYTEAGSIGYETLLESQKAEKTTLKYDSTLSQWLQAHQKALEREQVEVGSQYESIKQEALQFLNINSIELLIPVIMENKVNALLGIGKKQNLQVYTIKDIELLENSGKQIGITIDNALHHEDIVEKERLAEEMKLGREIQMNLLPREIPQIPGLTVRGLMQPAKEIGGDYYDFITLPQKDELAIVIGDVSGKGVAAGLLMAMAKTAIHTISQEEASPKQILLRTNKILNQHIGGQKFMTLLYLIWQAPTKTLTYSSAGHEHILVYRAQGSPPPQNVAGPPRSMAEGHQSPVEAIMSGGFMLGMMPDIGNFLEEKQITLSPGDKILLYTDGVTEAQNQQQDRFGLNRLIEALNKHGSKLAGEIMQAVKDEVYSFMGSYPQYDDITLVVMEAT